MAGVLGVGGVLFSVPFGIISFFDDSHTMRPSGVDLPMAVLALIALVPAIGFFLTQAELQRTGSAGDPHWEFHHYSGMAAAVLALLLCAFAASFRQSGRRLGVWLVGVSGVLLGGASLALSDATGAFDGLWAWLTLAWGIAVVAAAEFRPVSSSRS